MRYYFFSAILVLVAVSVSLVVPLIVSKTENTLAASKIEVPVKSSDIAGTYKYNLPPVNKNIPVPLYTAKAILIKDLNTENLLYEKNSHTPLPIASTTKIMTALIASSFFKPNTPILVSSASAAVSGSKVGLRGGETLAFRSVLYGMLLNSGNDAAFTIADNFPGGVTGFVATMNQKVLELNLQNTHFENPAGFDSLDHYSSASDLSLITEEALKDSQLARIFATKETEIFSLDKNYHHSLLNLNKLLSQVAGVIGVKTGYTEGAKENLVTLVERDGHRVLIVVLGSDDRFGETSSLIDWVFSNFQWQPT